MAEARLRRGRVEADVRPKEDRGEAEAWLVEADSEAEARTCQARPGHARIRLGFRGEAMPRSGEAEVKPR